MESLECHISSSVKTICFFKSLLSARTFAAIASRAYEIDWRAWV
jgi:hypothetical protein